MDRALCVGCRESANPKSQPARLCTILRADIYLLSHQKLPVALFLPGIGVVVVATNFPEARAILLHKLQTTEPLGALVGIELRHDQSHRTTMDRLQRLAIMLKR